MTKRPHLIIETLGACIDGNYEIALYCYARHAGDLCNWSKWLDLEKLAAKLGRDQSIMHDDLAPKLYCLQCGSRDVGLRLDPPMMRNCR